MGDNARSNPADARPNQDNARSKQTDDRLPVPVKKHLMRRFPTPLTTRLLRYILRVLAISILLTLHVVATDEEVNRKSCWKKISEKLPWNKPNKREKQIRQELGIPLGAEHAKVIGTIQEQKKEIRHELCISQDASHAELIQRIITLNGMRGKPLEPTETNREIIKQHFLISEVGREVRTRMLELEKKNRELEGKLSEARSTQNNHTRKELPNELAQRIKVLEKQNENLTRELTNAKAR